MSGMKARDHFPDLIKRAKYAKTRFIVTVRGKKTAAIIPIEDLEALEYLEDQIDMLDAAKARSEVKKKGSISWEKAKKDLNL